MKTKISIDGINIPAEDQLRVVTLNVLYFHKKRDERTRSICRQTNDLQPDVLCLQEVPFNDEDDESDFLKTVEKETGLKVLVKQIHKSSDDNIKFGLAILAKSDLHCFDSGVFSEKNEESQFSPVVYAALRNDFGKTFVAVTSHLCWGGENEGKRLAEASFIDQSVKKLLSKIEKNSSNETGDISAPIVALCGDFNSEPDSATLRFLKGLGLNSEGDSTLWVDSWDATRRDSLQIENLSDDGLSEDGATVVSSNLLAQETALTRKIYLPSLLPNRRIDYMLSYGWTYGKFGCALRSEVVFKEKDENGYTASDHFGIATDFWISKYKTD
jgi:endonuclease/exonuclease/phosphatase family metal-dependent hydrolase